MDDILPTGAPPVALATAPPQPAPTPPTALRTFGVEEELLLVDPATGRPSPVVGALLAADADLAAGADPSGIAALASELQQEQVETATPPRTALADIEADLRRLRDRAGAAARAAGALAVPLATSPLPAHPSLTPNPRYQAIQDRFRLTSDQQLTCGCHVHVAVRSAEEGVAVLDRVRAWLPVLAALAANSPYADGVDTGYAGYRTQAWWRWPTTGPADVYGSVAAYRARLRRFLDSGVPLDAGMFYPDARLSHRYPTVELRVADVCRDVRDAVLVAALGRALVETAAREWRAGVPAPDIETALIRLAAWRASRDGVEGELMHPVSGRPVPAATAVAALLDHVALALGPDAGAVGRGAERVLARGSGATWQRATVARTGDLTDLVRRSAL
ncbi:carboxylate-amine ligase [Cellulomonas hominis]|uniref:carboxylate-amine ligase n=1 Tax=Cellulomonas hominis TaxID=156981 RepID=UPI001443D942|nr:glutamate--cysteine ligase [Cellulomonas hominis]NKY11315.1 glutamate--cysteine ligase [Cellulomonas hominis]